jgi:hypothetical protein
LRLRIGLLGRGAVGLYRRNQRTRGARQLEGIGERLVEVLYLNSEPAVLHFGGRHDLILDLQGGDASALPQPPSWTRFLEAVQRLTEVSAVDY